MMATVLSVEDRDPYRFDAGTLTPVLHVETDAGIERVEWRRAGPPPQPGERVEIQTSDWYDDNENPHPHNQPWQPTEPPSDSQTNGNAS